MKATPPIGSWVYYQSVYRKGFGLVRAVWEGNVVFVQKGMRPMPVKYCELADITFLGPVRRSVDERD